MANLQILNEINNLDNKNLPSLINRLNEKGYNNLSFKEDDDLILIHNNKSDNLDIKLTELENECRTVILSKELEFIGAHFNEIQYNPTSLYNINLNECIIQESIEGTTLMCFNHNNKWHISTRRCINASSSKWIKDVSYETLMFDVFNNEQNTIDNFFNSLNPSNYYFFSLIHPLNQNIIRYNHHPTLYNKSKCLIHYLTRRKGTMNEVYYNIQNFNNVISSSNIHFNSVNDIFNTIQHMNNLNIQNNFVIYEGLVIRYYINGVCNIIKLQTQSYLYSKSIKPNYNDQTKCYIHAFKNNNLKQYLNIFTDYDPKQKANIVRTTLNTFKNLTTKLMTLYFQTRNKNNKELYEKLDGNSKVILYKLHGLYLQRCQDPNIQKPTITYNMIFNILKNEMDTDIIYKLL